MKNTRRYRRRWQLAPAVLASLAIQAGGVGAYVATRPPTPPLIKIEVVGEGTITSSPTGISCGDDCLGRYPIGTQLRLVAVLGEKATFEGWDGCQMSDWALECTLLVQGDATVTAKFGEQPEELEVAWIDPDTLPAPGETPTPEALTVTLPDPEIEAEKLLELTPEMLAPPPEVAIALPPPPPPEQAPPPPEEKKPPPPPPPNMTMVEVADENEVKDAPDDATHLSDKNRDVADETRATETNLERAQKGDAVASEQSDIKSDEVGGKEDEIAQLESSEASHLDAIRDQETPRTGADDVARGVRAGNDGEGGQEGEAGNDRPTPEPGVLSMRGIGGRGSIVKDEKPGDGGKSGDQGRKGDPGIKTSLDWTDYERIVGKDKVEAEQKIAQRTASKKRGRWERKLGAVKSALENFTPDVKPGNQQALKTRAHPFALFIARMHRKIHELWGFGFLEQLDDKPANHEMNNWDLWVNLELVVNPDGTIHKATIVKPSGVLAFDVAAIDTVISGEPYDEPPEEIRSPDGRVYMRWGFYRNWRQCGTFNSEPYILSEAPADSANAINDADLVRKGGGRTAATGTSGAGGREQPSRGGSEDPAAVHAANLMISAFVAGSPEKMAKQSVAPFRIGGSVAANSTAEIASIYRAVLSEAGPMTEWKLLSPAAYRKIFREVPPELADLQALLLVVRTKSEQFSLVLVAQADGAYRATGLYR